MPSFRLLFALLLCAATSHAAALNGRLAYVQNGAAYVVALPGGTPKMLPNSRGARLVSMAPRGGAVLYFVPQKGNEERGFIARPPYASTRALPAPLGTFDKFEPGNVQWSGDGQSALLASWDKSYLWRLSSGKIERVPGGEASLSRDGKQLAIAGEKELRLRDLSTGKERVLFSIARPQPLFDAMKRAKYPKNVKELADEISPDLWKDASLWNLGSLVFSADGATLWFACNAGTGAGAAGNTTWCWFACEAQTGRLAVLSRLGALFSRLPADAQLSPDGKKLLFVTSAHSSAIENPCAVSVLDLLTQKATEVLRPDERKGADTNLVYGTCWSPGSDMVAASALFYNTQTVMKNENWEPRNADYTLYIRDLQGRTLKSIRGAVAPSWGK